MRLHTATLRLLPLFVASIASAQPDIWTKTISSPQPVGIFGALSHLDAANNIVNIGLASTHLVVLKTTFNGQKIFRYQSTLNETLGPFCHDAAGDVYVVTTEKGRTNEIRIRKIGGTAGTEAWSFTRATGGLYNLSEIRAIYVTPNGDLMVAATRGSKTYLMKFNATDGAFVASAELAGATAVAVHPSGDLIGTRFGRVIRFAASNLTVKYDKSLVPPPGFTSLSTDASLRVAPDGSPYMMGGGSKAGVLSAYVVKLNQENGESLWSWSSPTQSVSAPGSMEVDSEGDAFVQTKAAGDLLPLTTRLASADGAVVWSTQSLDGSIAKIHVASNAVYMVCSEADGLYNQYYPGLLRVNRANGAQVYRSLPPTSTGSFILIQGVEIATNGKVLISGYYYIGQRMLTQWTYAQTSGLFQKVKSYEEKKLENWNAIVRPSAIGTQAIVADWNPYGWTFDRIRPTGSSAFRVNLGLPERYFHNGFLSAELTAFAVSLDKTAIYAVGKLGSRATLVKMSADSGQVVWRSYIDDTLTHANGGLDVVEMDGGDVMVVLGSNQSSSVMSVARVSGADGTIQWSRDLPEIDGYTRTRPVVLRPTSSGDVLFYDGAKISRISKSDGSILASRALLMASDKAEIAQISTDDCILLRNTGSSVTLDRIKASNLTSLYSVPVTTTNVQAFWGGVRILSSTSVGWVEARTDGSMWLTSARISDGQKLWSTRLKGIASTGLYQSSFSFAGSGADKVFVSASVIGEPSKWLTMCVDGPTGARLWVSTRANSYGNSLLPLSDGSVVGVGGSTDNGAQTTKAVRHAAGS